MGPLLHDLRYACRQHGQFVTHFLAGQACGPSQRALRQCYCGRRKVDSRFGCRVRLLRHSSRGCRPCKGPTIAWSRLTESSHTVETVDAPRSCPCSLGGPGSAGGHSATPEAAQGVSIVRGKRPRQTVNRLPVRHEDWERRLDHTSQPSRTAGVMRAATVGRIVNRGRTGEINPGTATHPRVPTASSPTPSGCAAFRPVGLASNDLFEQNRWVLGGCVGIRLSQTTDRIQQRARREQQRV